MTIGEVAKSAGLRASAIRFYEKAGLLPKPARASGRRSYGQGVLEVLAVLELAKACGFSLAETRQLFNGFRNEPRLPERWQRLAQRKIAELEALTQRIEGMKRLLREAQSCRCLDLQECGRLILKTRRGKTG